MPLRVTFAWVPSMEAFRCSAYARRPSLLRFPECHQKSDGREDRSVVVDREFWFFLMWKYVRPRVMTSLRRRGNWLCPSADRRLWIRHSWQEYLRSCLATPGSNVPTTKRTARLTVTVCAKISQILRMDIFDSTKDGTDETRRTYGIS